MKHLKTFENIDNFTKNLEYIDKLKDQLKIILNLINNYFKSNNCDVEYYIDDNKWESEFTLKNKRKSFNCKVTIFILDRKINIIIDLPIFWTKPLKYGYDFILDLFENINEIKLIKKSSININNNYHIADKFEFKVTNPDKAIDKLTNQINFLNNVKKYNL